MSWPGLFPRRWAENEGYSKRKKAARKAKMPFSRGLGPENTAPATAKAKIPAKTARAKKAVASMSPKKVSMKTGYCRAKGLSNGKHI